jgi:hypothetical protein
VKGHSGKAQSDVLIPILQEYGIVRKLRAVVGDNSSTNNTLYREIQDHLSLTEDLEWEAEEWRTRCMGHIINLAVQAFLFRNDKDIEIFNEDTLKLYNEIEIRGETFLSETIATKFRLLGPLGKLHNIITYSRSTTALQLGFKELTNGRLVPLNNHTR